MQRGDAQCVSAGANVAQLKTAIELHFRAMHVIEVTQVGQFDQIFVKWETVRRCAILL